MDDYRLLYVTVPTEAEGSALARRLVEENLAACAHLFPAGRSFYRWEGKVMEESEMVIIAKTRSDLAAEAIDRIAEWHSYDVACVLALPIVAGNEMFLTWISAETKPVG